MVLAAARRLMLQVNNVPAMKRGMADVYIPKPDPSMDHVFGDSSFKLPFNFAPPSALKTFGMTIVAMGIFASPVWIMLSEDMKMQEFLDKLEAAKAAKSAE